MKMKKIGCASIILLQKIHRWKQWKLFQRGQPVDPRFSRRGGGGRTNPWGKILAGNCMKLKEIRLRGGYAYTISGLMRIAHSQNGRIVHFLPPAPRGWSERGRQPLGSSRGCQHTILPYFPENCMELRIFWAIVIYLKTLENNWVDYDLLTFIWQTRL